jgi:site-specific DNA-methyltransferase (adenine-specific)
MINKLHPFEKPVELAEYIVRHTCLPNSLVVDPFAGSGNTARAAKKYNCEFMMSEKVEAYYNKSYLHLVEYFSTVLK